MKFIKKQSWLILEALIVFVLLFVNDVTILTFSTKVLNFVLTVLHTSYVTWFMCESYHIDKENDND